MEFFIYSPINKVKTKGYSSIRMNSMYCNKKIIISIIGLFEVLSSNVFAATNSYGGKYNYGSNVSGSVTIDNNNAINLDGVTLTPSSSDQEFFSTKIKFDSSSPSGTVMAGGSLTSNGGEFNVSNNSTLNGSITGASNTIKNSSTGNSAYPINITHSNALLSATGQQITVNDSTVNGSITGAKNESIGVSNYAIGGVYALNSQVNFTAKSGDINIDNSSVSGDVIGAINRSVADQAYSGISAGTTSTISFIATGDNLKLDDSLIQGKVVGSSNYIQGWTRGLSAQSNSNLTFSAIGGNIKISNSKVSGEIIGANNSIIGATGGASISNAQVSMLASGGQISVDNATVGSIYGARNDIIATENYSNAIFIDQKSKLTINATNSTINLSGNTVLSKTDSTNNTTYDAELWGGYINIQGELAGDGQANIYSDSFTGNTLNFSSSAITVAKMGNFENYNFSLNDNNKNVINSSTGLITVTDTLQNDDTVTAAGTTKNQSTAKLTGISGNVDIKNGDTIILVDATDAVIKGGDTSQTGLGQIITQGQKETIKVGLIKEVEVEYSFAGNDNQQLVATVNSNDGNDGGASVNNDYIKQLKALSESRLASLMAINRGADIISSDILRQIDQQPAQTFKPFLIIQSGYDRYNSGSHINSNTTVAVMGGNYQFNDHFSLGALYEYGNGTYDTYNSFNIGKAKGSGNTHYYGAGLIAKYTYDIFYTDASLRYGRSKTNYGNNDIITGGGSRLSYKNTVDYWGGHVGAGFTYAINNKNTLDTSLKYLVTSLDGADAMIEGSYVKFNKANSTRMQLGEQLRHQLSPTVMIFGGLAYDYEFNGRPRVKVDGYNIDKASTRGSTGIVELGVNVKPIPKATQLELGFVTKGYVGKHQGITGLVNLSYRF